MYIIINILCNKYIMLKTRNRLTKTKRNGKRKYKSNRTRMANMRKYKTKRVRHTKTHRHRTRHRAQNGGGFISSIVGEDALNLFRSIPASVGHLSDAISGQHSPASSYVYPTQQPHVNTISNINSSKSLLNLDGIYRTAGLNALSL